MNFKAILLPVFCFAIFQVAAQDVSKDFKTKSISIFKNGTSFIQKSGTVKTKDGKYKMTKHLPNALFGTFWFHSNDNTIKNVVSYKDKVITKKEVTTNGFYELLKANKGETVELLLAENEKISGTIEFVEKNETSAEMKDGNAFDLDAHQRNEKLDEFVTIKTPSGYLTIKTFEIKRVQFPSKPKQKFSKEYDEFKSIIEIDMKRNSASNQLDMMYLTGGLKWEPTYLIELISDTKAKLTLRAEVANDIEDIDNTDVNFVVGVPNFKYANRLSSLVELFGKMIGINSRSANQFSNQVFNAETYEVEAPQAGTTDLFKDATGSANEDLFFYTIKDFSLKKEGRGYFQMFEADVDIRHIYETHLSNNGTSAHHYSQKNIHMPASKNKVIHSVKLNNNSTYPWTSGAAMVVKKDGTERKPISQDRMFYTPVKGHSFVKLTEAPDIQVAHDEKTVKRQDNAKKQKNKQYHLITAEGQIKIKNYKSKAVDLNVHRTIIGKPLETSEKWLKADKGTRHNVNDMTDVCWEMKLKAGEEKVITYTYEVYVNY